MSDPQTQDQTDELVYVEAVWALHQSFRRDPLHHAFFTALRSGRPVGSRDPVSGRVSFPPRTIIEESHSLAEELVPLDGGGVIRTLTRQPGRAGRPPTTAVFVQLDGADTAAAGRLMGPGADTAELLQLIGRRCRLVIADQPKGAWSDYWFELD